MEVDETVQIGSDIRQGITSVQDARRIRQDRKSIRGWLGYRENPEKCL
jgi:hypothetical protein